MRDANRRLRRGNRRALPRALALGVLAWAAALSIAVPHDATARGGRAKPPAPPPPSAPGPVAPTPASTLAPLPWWDAAWSHRRVLTLAPPGPLAPHTAFAATTTHGAMRPDGQDLRVVGPAGNPVGVEVLEVGPGDQVTFLFEASEPTGRYAAYWGCPAPKTPSPAWTRDGGLVLEVRTWEHPFPVNAPYDAEFALRVAKDVESRTLRTRIFDGANPGGPSATYVGVYKGFFRVPEAAEYDLCTVSSDASILRVDQAEVSLWSKSHGPWAAQRGQFRTRVALAAGDHPIEYVHFAAGGQPHAAVVAIRKATEERWRVLWDGDYVQPVAATASVVETRTGTPPADFAWATVQHHEAAGSYLVRVRFESAYPAAEGASCAWDFGDGRTATGAAVDHVFVGRGTRTVTLRVGAGAEGGKAVPTGTQRVAADPLWTQPMPVVPGTESAWSSALAEAARAGLGAAEIVPALAAAESLGSDDLVKAVAEDAFARAEALGGAARADVFLTLAQFFDAPKTLDEKRHAEALALASASPGAPPGFTVRAALASAEDAAQRGDAARAIALLDRFRSTDLDDDGERRAALARADALVTLDRVDDASKALAGLEDRGPPDRRAAEASRRARLHAVSAWIAAGDAPAAVDGARGVLADYPREHLRAEAPTLLAQAWLRLDAPGRARVLLERALVLEPDGAAAPRTLLLLAEARARSGDAAGAASAKARLSTEFPYSDEAAEVARPPVPTR